MPFFPDKPGLLSPNEKTTNLDSIKIDKNNESKPNSSNQNNLSDNVEDVNKNISNPIQIETNINTIENYQQNDESGIISNELKSTTIDNLQLTEKSDGKMNETRALDISLLDDDHNSATNATKENDFTENISPNDRINWSTIDYDMYIANVPTTFGYQNNSYDSSTILDTVSNGSVLMTYPLHNLTKLYFPCRKINIIASHRHALDDTDNPTTSMRNCSFHVRIGTMSAYNDAIKKVRGLQKIIPNDLVLKSNIKNKYDYTKLFTEFYLKLFPDDSDIIRKSFINDELITISIFGRKTYLTEKTKLVKFNDHLIATASFVNNNNKLLFLKWIGVLEMNLNETDIHDDFTDIKDSLQKFFNIGTFLLSTCQYLKSVMYGEWTPIVCQVQTSKTTGAKAFYEKNYFLEANPDHEIIYNLQLNSYKHIIYDDDYLCWMILFHPLHQLYMFDIRNKSDQES